MNANNYDEFALYGVDGKRLATYKIIFTMPSPTGQYPAYATVTSVDTQVYFAGRLILQGGPTSSYTTPTDNIASTRSGPNTTNGLIVPSSFFPWGEEQTSTTNDRVKFATYRRDSESNLDYAWNRYYNNATARFMSPDPYAGSAQPADPQSWNRYAYASNDPINRFDPPGLFAPAPPADDGIADWIWETSLGFMAPVQIGVGGGGRFTPYSYPTARNDLSKPSCFKYFGFSSAKAAQNAFARLSWKLVAGGFPLVHDDPTGGVPFNTQNNPPAQNNPPGSNTIDFNYDYNWLDLSNQKAYNTTTGQFITIDFLGSLNETLGTNMTNLQAATLVLLHEFAHSALGGDQPQETNEKAFNLPIYNDCIK